MMDQARMSWSWSTIGAFGRYKGRKVQEEIASPIWRVKKEMSIGDIVSMAVVLSALFLAYGHLDTRISVLELQNVSQGERDRQQDSRRESALSDVVQRINALNDKIDRALELNRLNLDQLMLHRRDDTNGK
jgi:hypothetical protein